jgi:hypothetical protein
MTPEEEKEFEKFCCSKLLEEERERIRLIVAEYSRISAEATKDIIKLINQNNE